MPCSLPKNRPAPLRPGVMAVSMGLCLLLLAGSTSWGQTNQETPEYRDLAADVDRLVRRLYLATPEDGRMAMLGNLLGDTSPAIARAALDLAAREQAAGVRLHDDTISAVLLLLTHADAGVRLRAAGVVDLLADPRAKEPLAWALAAEQDEAIAQILLRTAARWPDSLERTSVIRWLNPQRPMGAGLGRAFLELDLQGRLDPEQDYAPALAAIDAVAEPDLTLSMCRLLARLGDEQRHQRLLSLLRSTDPTIRRRAATALSEHRKFAQAVLDAARTDPTLYDASAMIAQTLPPEQALSILLRFPGDDTPPTLERIRLQAARLPVPTLLRLHEQANSPARRIALLDSLRERSITSRDRGRGLVLLSKAQLEVEQFAQASETSELAETMLDASSPWISQARDIRQRAELAIADR